MVVMHDQVRLVHAREAIERRTRDELDVLAPEGSAGAERGVEQPDRLEHTAPHDHARPLELPRPDA